jgi:hypothetical protein
MTSITFFACCLYVAVSHKRMIAEPANFIEIYANFENLTGPGVAAQSSGQPVDGR